MTEIVQKLSSYHLLNYLLTGAILNIFLEKYLNYNILQDSAFINIFLFYFTGLTISRVGSIVVEPFLKKIGLLNFASYKDFLDASKKDNKIEVLSEINNVYRTFIAIFAILILLRIYKLFADCLKLSNETNILVLIITLLVFYFLSYLKQTKYITSRIENILNKK
ncbi:MAG: hypothetical protein ACK5LP_10320 [Campylobacteraceae bacterium]